MYTDLRAGGQVPAPTGEGHDVHRRALGVRTHEAAQLGRPRPLRPAARGLEPLRQPGQLVVGGQVYASDVELGAHPARTERRARRAEQRARD
eukprot:scaffold23051_cov69-Phaeocystis_antarctica.AAC.1